jgi:hypothetical protein
VLRQAWIYGLEMLRLMEAEGRKPSGPLALTYKRTACAVPRKPKPSLKRALEAATSPPTLPWTAWALGGVRLRARASIARPGELQAKPLMVKHSQVLPIEFPAEILTTAVTPQNENQIVGNGIPTTMGDGQLTIRS